MPSFLKVYLNSSYPHFSLSLLSIPIKASFIWYVTYLTVLVVSYRFVRIWISVLPRSPPSGVGKHSVGAEDKGGVLRGLVRSHIPWTWHLVVTNNTYLDE